MTVGLPPDHEVILSPGQLKSRDLRRIIHGAYGGDESMAMLTQVTAVGAMTNSPNEKSRKEKSPIMAKSIFRKKLANLAYLT